MRRRRRVSAGRVSVGRRTAADGGCYAKKKTGFRREGFRWEGFRREVAAADGGCYAKKKTGHRNDKIKHAKNRAMYRNVPVSAGGGRLRLWAADGFCWEGFRWEAMAMDGCYCTKKKTRLLCEE